jgi:nuclear protein localization protein 4 homolog
MYEQRIAWLYGYYSEDPNFKDGVRVNVEAIYEPP